jgi:hypothetical protein
MAVVQTIKCWKCKEVFYPGESGSADVMELREDAHVHKCPHCGARNRVNDDKIPTDN